MFIFETLLEALHCGCTVYHVSECDLLKSGITDEIAGHQFEVRNKSDNVEF